MRKVSEIQVSGDRCFPGNRWREAILFYFFGVVAEDKRVMHRPKIAFGDLTLHLHNGRYHAYGRPDPLVLQDGMRTEVVGPHATEVELGLVRFVKNPLIHVLRIQLPVTDQLALVKGSQRGELFVAATHGIPKNLLDWGQQEGFDSGPTEEIPQDPVHEWENQHGNLHWT